MKNKRARFTRFGSSRKKVVSDVSPSTSIPPLVEGQVRCFLRVTISRVLWTIAKPPTVTIVRLRWWGESTGGTLFCPRDGSLVRQKDVKSTTRFPVRCGPKQFTSYLTDMGSLVLDVLTKPDHLPIARVQVAGIARLSLSHSVNGFFTLVSPTSEKLGELQVTLALEPLTETHDSSSSVPTTDLSTEVALCAPCPLNPALSHCSGGRESVGGSCSSTPRGKDHLYFQEKGNTPFTREPAMKPHDTLRRRDPLPARSQVAGASVNAKLHEETGPDAGTQGHTSLDLLSVLLERGSKLRNAMVISALKSDLDSDAALRDTPFPLPRDNAGTPSLIRQQELSSGQLLQDLLCSGLQDSSQDPDPPVPDRLEDRHGSTVDLLLGGVNGSVLPPWDGDASLSVCSSLFLDSELGDPQFDQSLLENLFYRVPPDSCLSPEEKESHSLETNPRPDGDSGEKTRPEDGFPGLSVDKIALLGRMHLARVNILQLALPTSNTPKKLPRKGRPPLPLTTKKCSYFVEYLFPLPSSRDDELGPAVPSEVTRVVSSKLVEGAVNFEKRSVFPVHFDGSTIKKWWDASLTFRLFCRKSFQKTPVSIGTAELPLRSVLQSDGLGVTMALAVRRLQDNLHQQDVGPLKVSFELAADKKDFSSRTRKLGVSEDASVQPAPSKQADRSAGPQDNKHGENQSVCETEHRRDCSPRAGHSVPTILLPRSRSCPGSPHGTSQHQEMQDVLLHMLLMVPEGKDFNTMTMQPNVYLNCKLFGTEESTRSSVSWGQSQPTFNLVQVAPLALTSRLLERMKNNVMIIEVWLKASQSDNDKLLGLVKLPLHQFYMSFRERRVSQLLLQAQYPVVAVDSYVPVVDIFTGGTRGSLRVCLAMGLAQQIVALQRGRDEELAWSSQPPRPPVHQLNHRPAGDWKENVGGEVVSGAAVEHVFVVRVERATGLTPLQSTVWGEADCYVQYSFPTQEEEKQDTHTDPHTVESSLDLKSYRTATTLCVPDPVFGHCETHMLLAPPGVPVQKMLLSSLTSQGFSNGGGIQFEVWCRYYYPNVREQLAARGTLPMAKLCAMVTMQGRSQGETQLFPLPLVPRTDGSSELRPSGLLEVSVEYKSRTRSCRGKTDAVAPRVVNLLVAVHRATGLQAAARALALPYHSEVGVNAQVTMQLSFLPAGESRSTRAVARSFCPEFEHHAEFCCPLLIQREGGESVSLAEVLDEATAMFTVHHRDTRQVVDASRPRESILGAVTIRLADLLRKRTGICGWYALSPPPNLASHCDLTAVGGLELSVNFAHRVDRERVLRSAQLLGWETPRVVEGDDEEDVAARHRRMVLSVSVPRAWLPTHCLLLPGHSQLERSTYCYYRYQLYEQEAFCSGLSHPTLEEGSQQDLATLAFPASHSLELHRSLPLHWYLTEERLEVQLWVSFGKGKRVRPHDTDRLVGSAFIDLSALAVASEHKQTISGVYPLFKRSAADLGGAALRVHISMTTGSSPCKAPPSNQEKVEQPRNLGEEEEEEEEEGASLQSPGPDGLSGQTHARSDASSAVLRPSCGTELTDRDTFLASVSVERAMHLSLKGCPLAESGGGLPSSWVTYARADAPGVVTTGVVRDSSCPVWDHQQDCRLSKELLVDPQQLLVFKVWHKGEVERVMGFASVDLSPLLSGFHSVCGWYNITDFGGQCQGQLKVAVSPLVGVQELRPQRQAACENSAPDSSALFSALPLCYQTTASYGSFPSHISRFPEQSIRTSVRPLPVPRPVATDRHDEHMDSVRRFHQGPQEGESSTAPSSACDTPLSSAALLTALRKNLSELDDIQRYFSRKLATPVFSELVEQGHHPSQEEPESLTDRPQLLLRSDRQVEEVNSTVKGRSEHQSESGCSNPGRGRAPAAYQSDVRDPRDGGETSHHLTPAERDSAETEGCSKKNPEARLGDISAPPSHGPEELSLASSPESFHRDQCSDQDEDEERGESEVEEDEEFEETLIEPRPLNEVTSVTDRTSPWTSVLSDPDLGSLESEEAERQDAYGCPSPLQGKQRETAPIQHPSQPLTSDPADSDLSDGFESVTDAKELAGARAFKHHSDEEESVTAGLHKECSDEEEFVIAGLHKECSDEEEFVTTGLHKECSDEEESVIAGLHKECSDEEESVIAGLHKECSDEEEFAAAVLHKECSDEEEFVTAHLREDSTQGIQQRLRHIQHDSMCDSEDESPSVGPSTKPSDVESYELQTKLCDAVDIPNFFLPSHHMEASLRALRLAPVFPSVSSNPGTVRSDRTYRRPARPKPGVPPSSAKKEETKRIAKIFASHFTEPS